MGIATLYSLQGKKVCLRPRLRSRYVWALQLAQSNFLEPITMTTTFTPPAVTLPEKVVPLNQLWKVGLGAAALTAGVNALVYGAVQAAFGGPLVFAQQPGLAPAPVSFVQVIVASLIPALGATVLLGLLGKFTARPITIFIGIAVAFLLFSFGGPFALETDLNIKLALSLMHLTAAIPTIGVLVTRGKQE